MSWKRSNNKEIPRISGVTFVSQLSDYLRDLCARWDLSHAIHMPHHWGRCYQIVGLRGRDGRHSTFLVDLWWDEMLPGQEVSVALVMLRFVLAQSKQPCHFPFLFSSSFILYSFSFKYLSPSYYTLFDCVFIDQWRMTHYALHHEMWDHMTQGYKLLDNDGMGSTEASIIDTIWILTWHSECAFWF
jgi:hypothetical protein